MNKIKEAYDNFKLSDEAYNRVLNELEEKKKPAYSKRGLAACLAACIGATLIFGGLAFANDWFGLNKYIAGSYESETSENKKMRYTVSIVGITNSPEYMALNEWSQYREKHWEELLKQGFQFPCLFDFNDPKDIYEALDEEGLKMLNEITDKYGLKLINHVWFPPLKKDLPGNIKDLFGEKLNPTGIECTDVGSVHVEWLEKNLIGNDCILRVNASRKGYLSSRWGILSIPASSEENEYILENGMYALRIDEEEKTTILVDMDEYMVSIGMLVYDGNVDAAPTDEELKIFLDQLNLDVFGKQTLEAEAIQKGENAEFEDTMTYAPDETPETVRTDEKVCETQSGQSTQKPEAVSADLDNT